MDAWICVTCGVQFAAGEELPHACPICEDTRQYVGYNGQQWTTLAKMRADGFRNVTREHEASLTGIGTEPSFAIGQRPLLVQSKEGNILWDCMGYLGDEAIAALKQRGGIKAIAISHPHLYGSMVEWAERFDARIYLHEADRAWVMRPSERITFWSGDALSLTSETLLLRLGGHFPGSTVLHWKSGANGRGCLLTGDTISVAADRRWVSFMFSYPNMIPLPASAVSRIRDAITTYDFERLYGGWFESIVVEDAKNAVIRSADRYLQALVSEA
jgi:glyoxylase-like metal-dependent hydrolase (beta-lactamase superfamily II)